jgi:hypothetical protein
MENFSIRFASTFYRKDFKAFSLKGDRLVAWFSVASKLSFLIVR